MINNKFFDDARTPEVIFANKRRRKAKNRYKQLPSDIEWVSNWFNDMLEFASKERHKKWEYDKKFLIENDAKFGINKKERIQLDREMTRSNIEEIISNKKITKSEAKSLEVFLSKFITSLTQEEYNNLYNELTSFLEIKLRLLSSWDDEENEKNPKFLKLLEVYNLLTSYDANILDVLHKFISENVLLPKNVNQTEFNKKLKSRLYNILVKNHNEVRELPIFIDTTKINNLVNFLIEKWNYDIISSKKIDNWMNNFSYKVTIFDPRAEKNEKNVDEMYFTIWISKIISENWEIWVSREDFKNFIEEYYWDELKAGLYQLYSDKHFDINCEIKRKYIDKSANWNTTREVFDVEIYAEQKTFLTGADYFSKISAQLSVETSKLMWQFYHEFWLYPEITNFIDISPNDLENFDLDDDEDEEEYWKWFKNDWKIPNKSQVWNDTHLKDKSILNNLAVNSIDELILEEIEKKDLKLVLNMFNNPEKFKEHWLELPKWMILSGPPWVWKTLFLKLLAKEADAEFIIITHTDIETKWVWESESNIKKQFEKARKLAKEWKKVVLLFDEGDSLFEKRSNSWEKNYKEWILSVILTEIDGIDSTLSKNIFVAISTNRPDAIDPPLRERLNREVTLSLPSKEKRIEHLKLNINNIKKKSTKDIFDLENIDFEKISNALDKKSGRFIKNLITNVAENFVNDIIEWIDRSTISTQDIIDSIKITKDEEAWKKMGFLKW